MFSTVFGDGSLNPAEDEEDDQSYTHIWTL